jgi:uncharacterized membrane-anchored protein
MSINDLDRQPVTTEEPVILNPLPNPVQQRKLPYTRLAVPLFFQTVLICSISAQSIYALATGTTVVLKTVPVDPYDVLRGYSQTLSYDISSLNNLRKLPGWKELEHKSSSEELASNQQIYVTLLKNKSSDTTSPQAWQPVAISSKIPADLSTDKIAIRGTSNGNSVVYGLETYYMPEDRKNGVNADVNSAINSGGKHNLLVEIKVDSQGTATPIGLWVGRKKYQF